MQAETVAEAVAHAKSKVVALYCESISVPIDAIAHRFSTGSARHCVLSPRQVVSVPYLRISSSSVRHRSSRTIRLHSPFPPLSPRRSPRAMISPGACLFVLRYNFTATLQNLPGTLYHFPPQTITHPPLFISAALVTGYTPHINRLILLCLLSPRCHNGRFLHSGIIQNKKTLKIRRNT